MSNRVESLRIPEKPMGQDGSVVIAVNIGNEFTRASCWNAEDGCSNIIPIDGYDSIPTAIAYSVESIR